MYYADPAKGVDRWLRAVLLDMVRQRSDGEDKALMCAISSLIDIADPYMLLETFKPWVEKYQNLLAEAESKESSCHHDNSSLDREESAVLL